jgi:hypothetical protein
MRCIVLLALAALNLLAQSDPPLSVSAGFKIGSPLNDPSARSSAFSTYVQSRWTGGPTVELHLPYRFSVEFNALYRNYRANSSFPFQLGPNVNVYTSTSVQKTNAWDFPLLLKYRLQVGSIRPFVSAGHFWTHESTEASAFYFCSGPQGSCRPADYPAPVPLGGQYRSSATQRGPVGGAGIEFKTRHVMISPELRFSRPTYGNPRDNRFTALVGFTFGKKE